MLSLIAKVNNGLILTSDSRNVVEESKGTTEQLFRLTNYIGVVTSGEETLSTELIQHLKLELEKYNLEYFSEEVADLAQSILFKGYNQWLEEKEPDSFPNYYIIAGKNHEGGFSAYFFSSPDFTPILQLSGPTGICVIGSNEEFRELVMNKIIVLLGQLSQSCNMNINDMAIQQIAMMVVFALDTTVKSQAELNQGGSVQVAVVDENGFYLFPYTVDNTGEKH